MKLKVTEKEIQRSILDYLQIKGYFHFRNNTGAMSGNYKGKKWFVHFGSVGSGDIIGCLKDGRIFSIEVKAPGKKPSESQVVFMTKLHKSNGVAFVAYSVEDVIREFELYENQSVSPLKVKTQSLEFMTKNGDYYTCQSTTL